MMRYAVERPFALFVVKIPRAVSCAMAAMTVCRLKPACAGDGPDARVSPIGSEVGVEADDEVDLDCGASEGLEGLGAKEVVLDAEEIRTGGHGSPLR